MGVEREGERERERERERGDVRTFQESFHIMCQGQSLDGKGCRSQTKEAKTKEGKAEEDIGEPFKNQAIIC